MSEHTKGRQPLTMAACREAASKAETEEYRKRLAASAPAIDPIEQLERDRDELLAALRKLVNETAGILESFPVAIREAISNTNYECLKQRVVEADALLAKHARSRDPQHLGILPLPRRDTDS